MNEDKHLTSKQKIDQVLGIESNQSIDDFLNGMSLDCDEISSTFSNIDDAVKANIEKIDNSIKSANSDQTSALSLKDIDSSLKEVEELI